MRGNGSISISARICSALWPPTPGIGCAALSSRDSIKWTGIYFNSISQIETEYSNNYAGVSKAIEHFSDFGGHKMYSVDKFEFRRNNQVQGQYIPPVAYHPAHVN